MPKNGSASLPDDWREQFEEMTSGLQITVTREYQDLTPLELAEKYNSTKKKLRSMEEMLKPRSEEGRRLHAVLEDLNEELNRR